MNLVLTLLVAASIEAGPAPGGTSPDAALQALADRGAVVTGMAAGRGRRVSVSFPSGELPSSVAEGARLFHAALRRGC